MTREPGNDSPLACTALSADGCEKETPATMLAPFQLSLVIFVCAALVQSTARADFSFAPGDYYSSTPSTRTIFQYDPSGHRHRFL